MDISKILRRPMTYVIAVAIFVMSTFIGSLLFGYLGGGQLGLFGYLRTYNYAGGPTSTFHPLALLAESLVSFALAVIVQFGRAVLPRKT